MKKNIAFIFPYNSWGGAFRSTYTLANGLIDKGWKVDIIFPFIPPRNGFKIFSYKWIYLKLYGLIRSLIKFKKIPFKCRARIIYVPWISSFWISSYDFIIANHWNTVEDVYNLSNVCGKKIHFIRDIEQWAFYFDKELNVFRLPIKKIAVSNWVKNSLIQNYNVSVDEVITNGIDYQTFKNIKDKPNFSKIKIGMCCSNHPMKGINIGINALKKIQEIYTDRVEIIFFGFHKPKVPENFKFKWVHKPINTELRDLYNSLHIFLFTSLQEGFGNPPLEAMVAKCCVITTLVGAMYEVGINNQNCFIVNNDIKSFIDKIVYLIERPEIIKNIGLKAENDLQNLGWDKSIIKLDKFLTSNL